MCKYTSVSENWLQCLSLWCWCTLCMFDLLYCRNYGLYVTKVVCTKHTAMGCMLPKSLWTPISSHSASWRPGEDSAERMGSWIGVYDAFAQSRNWPNWIETRVQISFWPVVTWKLLGALNWAFTKPALQSVWEIGEFTRLIVHLCYKTTWLWRCLMCCCCRVNTHITAAWTKGRCDCLCACKLIVGSWHNS